MAKPIKETPILTGRDAVDFFRLMKQTGSNKLSAEAIKKMRESSDRLKSIEQ